MSHPIVPTRRQLLAGAGALAGAATLGRFMDGPAFAALPGPLRLFTVAVAGRDKDIVEARKDLDLDIRVTFNVAHTETFAKLNAGVLSPQQDVIHIQQPFVKPLAQRRWIQPVEPGRLKNHAKMFPQFKQPEWVMLDGKMYGLPYYWGYDSIVYNARHMPDGGETWGRLWDDRYKGRLSLRDDALSSIQPVALFLGHNPNRLTKAQLEDCKKFLIGKKRHFRQLWSTYAEAVNLLRSEEVWALWGWLPMVTSLRKEGMDIRYGLPKEKAIAWFAAYVISKDTKVLPSVYAFLDWVLDEKFATSMARDFGYRMTTTAHVKNLTPAEIKDQQLDDIERLVGQLFIQELPENLNDWVQAWSEFKSA
jgi:spermidine/putrescine-binding protein